MTTYRFRVTQDTDPCNPRTEWDNAGILAALGRAKYCFDKNESFDNFGAFVASNLRTLTDDEIDDVCRKFVRNDRDGYTYYMDRYRGSNTCKSMRRSFVEDIVVDAAYQGCDDCTGYLVDYVDAVWRLVYVNDYDGSASCGDVNEIPENSRPDAIIYCDRETITKEWGNGDDCDDKAARCLEAEVSTYSDWASGNVWGFELESTDEDDIHDVCECCGWTHVDSCWGFIGYATDDDLAAGMLEHVGAEYRDIVRQAVRDRECWKYQSGEPQPS